MTDTQNLTITGNFEPTATIEITHAQNTNSGLWRSSFTVKVRLPMDIEPDHVAPTIQLFASQARQETLLQQNLLIRDTVEQLAPAKK